MNLIMVIGIGMLGFFVLIVITRLIGRRLYSQSDNNMNNMRRIWQRIKDACCSKFGRDEYE